VDNAYQESQRSKWRDWLPQLYSAKGTIQDYFESNSEHRRDLHIQIELNRLKYTVFGNVARLRPPGQRVYPALDHMGTSVKDFSQMLNDMVLLSPDVKLHQSNIRALQVEIMAYRFDGSLVERRAVLGALLALCQQMRVNLYYQIQKNLKKVQICQNSGQLSRSTMASLYYFQPDTQQEHLALHRSLNLNEKIITKQEEEKVQKRRISFGNTLVSMH